MESAPIAVRLARKRKPSAAGYLVRDRVPLPEEQGGLAISTFGKVIKRGWDWLGLTPATPDRVGGLIEAPALAECLTLNKADFIRVGVRGAVYLAYRKAIQEAVAAQLAAWGDLADPGDHARRRAARPWNGIWSRFSGSSPRISPCSLRWSSGGPAGSDGCPRGDGATGQAGAICWCRSRLCTGKRRWPKPLPGPAGQSGAPSVDRDAPGTPPAASTDAGAPPALAPAATLPSERGRRQPGRYGLSLQFAQRPDDPELARLIESTVWINEAHPAYRRAAASRSEGYHLAVAVALALAPPGGGAGEGARLPDRLPLGLGRGNGSAEASARLRGTGLPLSPTFPGASPGPGGSLDESREPRVSGESPRS